MTLFERVHLPSFAGATEWLNSEPLGQRDAALNQENTHVSHATNRAGSPARSRGGGGMSALKTTADKPALQIQPIARDQARALLGQVMGLVAVSVAFTALGAYLGRDLSGGTGLVLFIAAF